MLVLNSFFCDKVVRSSDVLAIICCIPLALHEGKPKLATPVAYPFAVVKPSGVEGDVTLNDINQRISMPPTRPIQHPVGDHAKPPSLASSGSGLSGKAVVALTKIHTEGKGTITIMRTKG